MEKQTNLYLMRHLEFRILNLLVEKRVTYARIFIVFHLFVFTFRVPWMTLALGLPDKSKKGPIN